MLATQPQAERDKRMYDAGRLRERRRPRTSGSAVDARPYRNHITVRMSYYEAEVFSSIMEKLQPQVAGSHPEEKKAFGRLLRKARACRAATAERWNEKVKAIASLPTLTLP